MLQLHKWAVVVVLACAWGVGAGLTDVILGEEYEGAYQVQQGGVNLHPRR